MPNQVSNYSKEATRPNFFLSHLITITSETAVGSSTTMKVMQEILGSIGWRYVSGGSIMRMYAASQGMTIEEFAAYNRKHPEDGFDLKCDTAQATYGQQNHCVIESRLAHAFVPHAFHVRLICLLGTRAERRHADLPQTSLTEIIEQIVNRDENDKARYEQLYPGCLWPDEDFDLVIDTAITPAKLVAWNILDAHEKWRAGANVRTDISI